jgi:hypothetical protein
MATSTPNFQSINPMDNENIAQYLRAQSKIDGRSMKALKVERESLLASLKATGQAQPAVIVWLNPVAGHLDGGIFLKLRSINDPQVLEEDRRVFKYNNREYKATIIPIKDPLIFTVIKDVKVEGDREYGIYEPKACKQIEIAHHFLANYTTGTPNSSGMGGILVFEGTKMVLDNVLKRKVMIKVPRRIQLPNGWSEYENVEQDFHDALAATLDMQKSYANTNTQQAQSFWDQEDQRGNITTVHRVWHQFEMDMGFRATPAPWITLNNENPVTCAGCGEPRKRVDAYFCKCGRVYDPLQAYMDGEIPVTHDSMLRVTSDEDWKKIHAEETKRKKRRGAVQGTEAL